LRRKAETPFCVIEAAFFLEMACENTPLQGSRLVVEEGNEEFLRFLAVRLIELRQAAAV
jgi:hypothetical protein